MRIVVVKRAFYNGSLVEPGKVIEDYEVPKGKKMPSWAAPAAAVEKPPKAEKKPAGTPPAGASTTQKQAGNGKSDNIPRGAGDAADMS